MKRFLLGLLVLGMITACDDGGIVVTNFDFEESTLQFCAGPQSRNRNVIYAINNDNVFESISLEVSSSQIKTDEDGNFLPPEEDTLIFQLSGSNRIVYRIYSSSLDNNYFCNLVPPSEPTVIEEWISGDGAEVYIFKGFRDETGDADADGDGILNINEGWQQNGPYQDTDEDGIPDYLDVDDDNDNVRTEDETGAGDDDPIVVINGKEYLNTDGESDTGDDIPDYLDPDDDGDGVITRYEVKEGDEDDPTKFSFAEGIPNYLNPEQDDSLIHDIYLPHNIERDYGFRIIIKGLNLSNNVSGETIKFESYNFGTLTEDNVPFPQCPNTVPDCSTETPPDETPAEQ